MFGSNFKFQQRWRTAQKYFECADAMRNLQDKGYVVLSEIEVQGYAQLGAWLVSLFEGWAGEMVETPHTQIMFDLT